MNLEIRILAWTVVLGFVHIVAAAHAASLQRGYRWAASARDHVVAPLTGVAGRLDRALRNFSETFPLFAALLLAAQGIGRHSWLTEAGRSTTLLPGSPTSRSTLLACPSSGRWSGMSPPWAWRCCSWPSSGNRKRARSVLWALTGARLIAAE